jgi:hypothetical protein
MSKYETQLGDTIYDIVRKRIAFENDDTLNYQMDAIRRKRCRDWDERQRLGYLQIQTSILNFNSDFKVGEKVVAFKHFCLDSVECVVRQHAVYTEPKYGWSQYAIVMLEGWIFGRNHYGGDEAFILDDGTDYRDQNGVWRIGGDGMIRRPGEAR